MRGPWVCALCAALAVSGCGGARTMVKTEAGPFQHDDARIHAGAASVDITPPPGLGLFGHGPESRVSEGQRLRLRCQVLLLQGRALRKAADRLALVTCDLGQPSLLLQREIARRAADAGVRVGAERIVLLATHTHAGPGHYFDSGNLSGIFSSRLTGHDPKVVAFLSERIAQGLVQANRDLLPARVGWAYDEVYGLSRNRSLSALRHNRTLPEPLKSELDDDALVARWGADGVALDPRLAVLRVDHYVGGTFVPRAVFSVFGVHPTVITNDEVLYGGDLFGYATRQLEGYIGGGVVAAFANGIEGDVAPDADARGAREARRMGRVLADRAHALWQGLGQQPEWLSSNATLDVAYRELEFPSAAVGDGPDLCERPEIGTAAAGGAADNPTSLRVLAALNPGVRAATPRACHGHKFPLLQPLGPAQPGHEFPGTAPISLIRIGAGILASVPVEITTVAGLRIREALLAAAEGAPVGVSDVMLLGLANQYLQYVATEDEYPLQQYEGASTLYGPGTAAFLREQHVCLARHLLHGQPATPCHGQTRAIDAVHELEYDPGGDTDRLRPAAQVTAVARLGAPQPVETPDARLGCQLDFVGPNPWALQTPNALRLEVVAVSDAGDTGAVVDTDEGQSMELRLLDTHGPGAASWRAIWTPAFQLGDSPCGRRYRFVVRTSAGEAGSADFVFACERPACQVVP